MEFKQKPLQNIGMSQDKAISKEDNNYAYKNRNIRINASDEGTVASITNIKGAKKINNITIPGTLLATCKTPEYLVLFTKDGSYDCIYRINLDTLDNITVPLYTLYRGTELNFHIDRVYDTLYYEENINIKKVYWCEDWKENEENNTLRFINIITEGERNGGTTCTPYTSNVFEFYPMIGDIPTLTVDKIYNQDSELPAGVIQYFITYYNTNGAETKICQESPLITLHPEDRGSKEDEMGNCATKITISNYSTDFDYIRIYSAVRNTLNGAIILHITADIEISKSGIPLTFIDTYKSQETLQDTQIFFIGGTSLCAKTIEQKQGTLFAGNIHSSSVTLSNDIKELFESFDSPYVQIVVDGDTIINYWSKIIKFTRRNQEYLQEDILKDGHSLLFWDETIPTDVEGNYDVENDTNPIFSTTSGNKGEEFKDDKYPDEYYKETSYKEEGDSIYAYTLSTNNSTDKYLGFKHGEIYRFGLQFQDSYGQWTEVLYIGDGECRCTPGVDTVNKKIYYTNVVVKLPQELIDLCTAKGYKNYKLVYADPELNNGRKIIAQGILNPTVFSPLNRYMKTSWAEPSWIFRPANGDAPYHHFQRMASYWDRTSEIANIKGNESILSMPTDLSSSIEDTNTTDKSASENLRNVMITIVVPQNNVDHTTLVYAINCSMSKQCYESNFTEDTDSIENVTITEKKAIGYSNVNNAILEAYGAIQEKNSDNIPQDLSFSSLPFNKNNVTEIFSTSGDPRELSQNKGRILQILFWEYWNTHKNSPTWDWLKYCNLFSNDFINRAGQNHEDGKSPIDKVSEAKSNAWYTQGYLTKAAALYSDVTFYKTTNAYCELMKMGWLPMPIDIINNLVDADSIPLEDYYGYFADGADNIIKGFGNIIDKSEIKITNIPGGVLSTAVIKVTASQYTSDQLNKAIPETKQIATYMNNDAYFVDNSIVTFNSPDFDEVSSIVNSKLSMDIVGAAYINANYGKRTIELSNPGRWSNAEIQDFNSNKYIGKVSNTYSLNTLLSEYSYIDRYLQNVTDSKGKTATVLRDESLAYFMTHMWEMSGSITGVEENNTDLSLRVTSNGNYEEINTSNKPLTTNYATLKFNKTYNYKVAEETKYVIGNVENKYQTGPISIANETSTNFNTEYFNSYIYNPEVNKVILGKSNIKYVTNTSATEYLDKEPFTKTDTKTSTKLPALINPGDLKPSDFSDVIDKITDYYVDGFLDDFTNTQISTDIQITEEGELTDGKSCHIITTKNSNAFKTGSTRITYKSTPHAVFTLGLDGGYLAMLPYTSSEEKFDNKKLYCGDNNEKLYTSSINITNYPWGNSSTGFNGNRLISTIAVDNFLEINIPETIFTVENIEKTLQKEEVTTDTHKFNFKYDDTTVMSLSAFLSYKKGAYRVNEESLAQKVYQVLKNTTDEYKTKYGITVTDNSITFNPDIVDGIYFGINVIYDYNISNDDTENPNNYTITVKNYNFLLKVKGINVRKQSAIPHYTFTDYEIITDRPYFKLSDKYYTYSYGNTFVNKVFTYTDVYDPQIINPYNALALVFYNVALDASYKEVATADNNPMYKNRECDSTISSTTPMLYIGELKRNLEHKDLYGGFSDSALERLVWLPASNYTPITDIIKQSYGDTYFQRYDCLKTYPRSEEDLNQVTDIASVMIETHKNLDTRTDVNRWNFNTMARPENFGLYNSVYNQKNNIFTGTILPDLMDSSLFRNKYVWSSAKNVAGRVDSWTNLSLNSYNNAKYDITKITNYNDNLIMFETNAIEHISFKEKYMVDGGDNNFISVDFNDKVVNALYRDNYGTYNPNILTTPYGIYFFDDNKHTLVYINVSGEWKELPVQKMDSYFSKYIKRYKGDNNLVNDRLLYDALNKEVYIILNDEDCIIYNEPVGEFTSYVDCKEVVDMITYNNKSYFMKDNMSSTLYTMYAGRYNTIYDNGNVNDYVPYSIEYRMNLNEYTDKVFTNVEFTADLDTVQNNSNKSFDLPFDKIRVFTEYQDTGTVSLQYDRNTVSNLKQRFRVWRALIPRAMENYRDRIRNPWAHMILTCAPNKDTRLELHNIIIDYLE